MAILSQEAEPGQTSLGNWDKRCVIAAILTKCRASLRGGGGCVWRGWRGVIGGDREGIGG